MSQRWDDYERAVEYGPWAITKKALWFVIPLVIGLSILGYVLGWFEEAAKVAKDEFGPKAMLVKYEWFKDTAAQLDKKRADVDVFEGRITRLAADYRGIQRGKWARDDREQYSVWASEVAGVKASYNQLASEYNSQMAKFNWAFANVGMLPPGAETPLPREYKSYIGG